MEAWKVGERRAESRTGFTIGIVHRMPVIRHLLPPDRLLFEIIWEPGSLGSAAQAVVDVLRFVNGIAALESPNAPPPLRWRWVRCDGSPAKPPALAELPAHERSGAITGRVPTAYRERADVVVAPGWMVRTGPEIDQWVGRSSLLKPSLQQTLAQGGALLGVFTGVALLAAAGCLRQRRFAAPWPFFVSVMRHASASGFEAAKSVNWSDAPDWTSDSGVWTCASPVATTEAVLDLIGSTPLVDLASAARDVLLPAPLRQAVTVVHARTEGARLDRNRLPHGIVERARQWLVKHLAEPYDARAVAKAAATSPRTLARHFAATHGMSAHDYLERLRVERACLLLQTTHITVEEIGRSSGLESPSTFRRVFQKHTGTLPGEYRRRYRLRTQRPRWGSEALPMPEGGRSGATALAGARAQRPG
jgi:transcriptional regulator GlxA family with amidase domain